MRRQGVPIVGRQTAAGLSFGAKSLCDVTFTVELARATSGWAGKATTTSGNTVVVELKAE